jgi:hypothetical protein
MGDKDVKIPAEIDQPVSDDFVESRPLIPVIVSHGLLCKGHAMSTFSRELASYGFFVVAINHHDGTCSYTVD